jgi:dihydrofolate reductase
MRKVIVNEFMSLDGVVQAPGAADEATTIHVIGSAQLVRALLDNGLVDELRLMLDPVVLGGGKRIFSDDGTLRSLQLVDSEVTTTGAILATYGPAS